MPAGAGESRSNYGVKTFTPEEIKNEWIENVERAQRIRKNHKCAMQEREGIEKVKNGEISQISYFNNNKQHAVSSTYDRQFHVKHGYHSKLRRDDREHTLGLNVHAEEHSKKVPILSSTTYGHRQPLEMPPRKHTRVALVQRDFYRNCGTNIPTGVPNERDQIFEHLNSNFVI